MSLCAILSGRALPSTFDSATSAQEDPSIAMDSLGNYVVVYTDYDSGSSSKGVFAQRYQSNGTAIGTALSVNTTTTGDQYDPEVAMDHVGNFVVVWTDHSGFDYDVYARRFDTNGVPLGDAYQVNSEPLLTAVQHQPDVAMDAVGNYTIVYWVEYALTLIDLIAYKRYSATGTETDGGLATSREGASNPEIALDDNNNGYLVWRHSSLLDAGNIMMKPISTFGDATTGESIVNTTQSHTQSHASVSISGDGSQLAVAWQSGHDTGSGQDGSAWGVYTKAYNLSAGTDSGEQRVNDFTLGAQSEPSVAMNDQGSYVVTFTDYNGDKTGIVQPDVYVQEYLPTGIGTGPNALLNSTTSGNQTSPAVVMNNAGQYATVWATSSATDPGSIEVDNLLFGGGSLPVTMGDFVAACQPEGVLLKWQTLTEHHNSGFEVQRSKDGSTWATIDWVEGRGDTYEPTTYQYLDR